MLALLALTSIRFHVVASEFANAVYHVSCLTGRIQCTNAVFTDFWNNRYAVTRDDGEKFDTWRNVFQSIEGKEPSAATAPLLPNYAGYYPALRLRSLVLQAAFSSRSPAEFEKRARRLMSDDDALKLRTVIEHVQLRLRPWWKQTGKRVVEAQAREIRRQLSSNGQPELLADLARFFNAELPERDIYINLILSPAPESKNATATYVKNQVTIEIGRTTKPLDAVWITMHELTHALYEAAPRDKHSRLMKEFVATKERSSQPLYGLLNEALATGLQLLVYERVGLKDEDPYHHPYIPRLGRVSMPLIKEALRTKTTLFDGFALKYIEAGRAEMKDEQESARFLWSVTAVLASDKNEAAAQAFYNEFRPLSSVDTNDNWTKFFELNGIRLLTYDELPSSAGNVADVHTLTRSRNFAYVYPRGETGSDLMLAGRTLDDVLTGVKRLSAVTSIPHKGVVFTTD